MNIKDNYKKAIKDTLQDIENNINDIVDIAFKNNTKEIHIDISIEPGNLVGWSFKEKINTNPCRIVKNEENE